VQIKYGNFAFEFIDVPGHEELTKNMISGASYADAALLMVSTKKDEGIKMQTRRHLFIAKMLGIQKIVVAINKMDLAGYDKKIFEEMKSELLMYLINIGFKEENLDFVPISAYTGEMLIKKSKNMSWYKGSALINSLIELTNKSPEKKNEVAVLLQGTLGNDKKIVTGKVLSGSIEKNTSLKIMPSEEITNIKNIVVRGDSVKKATVGENVAFALENEPKSTIRGSVLIGLDNKQKPSREILATVFFIRNMNGHLSVLINGSKVNCKSIKINKTIDLKTGEEVNKNKIKPLSAAKVLIRIEDKIYIDKFDKIPELGRFAIYDNDTFSGIGIVDMIK
ncbi:MAG: GTP-binding protein, partial [Candidatus Micrarchaeia archaeon]